MTHEKLNLQVSAEIKSQSPGNSCLDDDVNQSSCESKFLWQWNVPRVKTVTGTGSEDFADLGNKEISNVNIDLGSEDFPDSDSKENSNLNIDLNSWNGTKQSHNQIEWLSVRTFLKI